MNDFSIGAITTLSFVIIFFVIRASNKKTVHNKVVFENTTAAPWSQRPQAPAPETVSAPVPVKRETVPTMTQSVGIPLWQAVITVLLFAFAIGALIKVWFSWSDALIAFGLTLSITPAVIWSAVHVFRKLMYFMELRYKIDINRDHVIGDPKQAVTQEQVVIKSYDHNGNWERTRIGTVDLNFDEKRKLAFSLLMQNRSFSESALARGEDGYLKIFSQPRFTSVQKQFIKLELVNKKGSGYELNDDGKNYLSPALPSPTGESVSLPAYVGKVGTR